MQLKKRPTIANNLTLTRFRNNHASGGDVSGIDVMAAARSIYQCAQIKIYDGGVH